LVKQYSPDVMNDVTWRTVTMMAPLNALMQVVYRFDSLVFNCLHFYLRNPRSSSQATYCETSYYGSYKLCQEVWLESWLYSQLIISFIFTADYQLYIHSGLSALYSQLIISFIFTADYQLCIHR